MKRVLILVYDFPPYISVGGLRPYGWYRYLKKYNVYPVVVTRQWDNVYRNELDYISKSKSCQLEREEGEFGTIYKAPFLPNFANRLQLKYGEKRFLYFRKSLSLIHEVFQYLGPFGPKRTVYSAAKSIIKKENIDVIIASGEPFVLFHYANKLSKEFQIPWIADYRDPWTGDLSSGKNKLLKYFYKYLEKKMVSNASHISTVSEFVHSKIEKLIINKPFSILPNGYNPDNFKSLSEASDNETFRFSFAGTIYPWHPLESFVKVISQFIIAHPEQKILVSFYGINTVNELKKYIQKHGHDAVHSFEIIDRTPNDILLKYLKKSHVLVLFNYYSFMGTKIFDYIGLKRKILFCYSNDEGAKYLKKKYYLVNELEAKSKTLQEDLLRYTQSGVIVENEKALFGELELLLEEFKVKKEIQCNSVHVEEFSREIQVKKLAKIIEAL